MLTTIDEAVKIPAIKRELRKKFKRRIIPLSLPSNPRVNLKTPCQTLPGKPNGDGYKIFKASNKKLGYDISVGAHIAANELFNKTPRIVNGKVLQVQHTCGETVCVEPTHLIIGGPQQNGTHASKIRMKRCPNQGSWKINVEDKEAIKELYFVYGDTVAELSEEFNLSKTRIYKILKGG